MNRSNVIGPSRWMSAAMCSAVSLMRARPAVGSERDLADPRDPNVLYLGVDCNTSPGPGVYKSTDGGRSFVSTTSGRPEIYVMDSDGRDPRRLTESPFDGSRVVDFDAGRTTIAWSPDSKQIAFVSNREGAQAIYLVNITGTDTPRRVTPLTSSDAMQRTPSRATARCG